MHVFLLLLLITPSIFAQTYEQETTVRAKTGIFFAQWRLERELQEDASNFCKYSYASVSKNQVAHIKCGYCFEHDEYITPLKRKIEAGRECYSSKSEAEDARKKLRTDVLGIKNPVMLEVEYRCEGYLTHACDVGSQTIGSVDNTARGEERTESESTLNAPSMPSSGKASSK